MGRWQEDRKVVLDLSKLGLLRRKNLTVPFSPQLKSRKVVTSILRLRIGHCSLRAHLYRLNLVDSPNCACGSPESIEHVLLFCPKYYSSRVQLRQSLLTLRLPFVVGNILGGDDVEVDKQGEVFRLLAVFLCSTGLVDRI